jgi:uroporphyrinogen III methyltransferase/synthase
MSQDRPLENLRVLVTRPEDPRDPLAEQLRQLGATVILQPAIRIAPPTDWRPVDAALARLEQFDWLVFSSANGVRYLLNHLQDNGFWPGEPRSGLAVTPDSRRWGTEDRRPFRAKVAAIGPGTDDELARYGLRADLVPEQYRAEVLAEALVREILAQETSAPDDQGRWVLLIRASRGRDVLAQRLSAAGVKVEQVVVYASLDVEFPDPTVIAMLRAGEIDWITVTSSAIGRSLAKMFGDDLRRAQLATISPITSATLRALGHQPAAEAEEYTIAGLVQAIVRTTK